MKKPIYIFMLLFVITESCSQEAKQKYVLEEVSTAPQLNVADLVAEVHEIIHPLGTTIETRILAPANFQRTVEKENSYPEYLRSLPLKPHGSEVMLFNGDFKPNYDTYDAVIDMEVGNKDLHQCADAVMRLRAEYLWNEERYDEIHFNFTNGFSVDYTKWIEGSRMVVKGNKTHWVNKSIPSKTYQDFWGYMELIFNYAGTLSLSKELIPVEIKDIKIGDVFIWGGSPGHAVLVIDMAKNPATNEKFFLLAQSYMPAQEIQLLQNPNNEKLSPWNSVSEIGDEIITPEWVFQTSDLKRVKK